MTNPITEKFFIVSVIYFVLFSMMASTTQAQYTDEEVQNMSTAELTEIGEQVLKAYEYDYATQTYEFDREQAQELSNLSDQQIANVEGFLSNLSPAQLEDLQESKADVESDGVSTQAVQLLPLIGAAAIGIVAAVGTTVASNFADDIYNYGLTTACRNFDQYNAIENFCTINDYI